VRRAAALLLLLGPAHLQAQAPELRGGLFELNGFAHHVSGDFGDWRGGRARLVVPAGSRDVFFIEGLGQRAFHDDGLYGALAHQHAFGDSWITFLSVGGGTGKFVLPDLRVDAMVTRKLLPSRRLLVTAGGSWVVSKDVYRDRAATGSVTMYLSDAAVLELGGRFNWSRPGDVASQRAQLALTLGRQGSRYLVIRGSAGTEAYQLTGSGATEQKFRSREAAVTWREWLGRRMGIAIGGEAYHNPFYTRTGVQVGLFTSW
jgi:YaiO family outer membrane protein